MKHISHNTFLGTVDDGQFKMPTTVHKTYCGQVVQSHLIDNKNPTCDDCMDSKCWERIDEACNNDYY